MSTLGFRASGFGRTVRGLEFRNSGFGFRVSGVGMGFRVLGCGYFDFQVSGLGFAGFRIRVWGSEFRAGESQVA